MVGPSSKVYKGIREIGLNEEDDGVLLRPKHRLGYKFT